MGLLRWAGRGRDRRFGKARSSRLTWAWTRTGTSALRPVLLGPAECGAGSVFDLGEQVEQDLRLGRDEIAEPVDHLLLVGGRPVAPVARALRRGAQPPHPRIGLPFVGIPLQPEQDANVTFAQNQGAARLVPQHAAGTPAMTAAARDLLADDAARDCARRLQQIFAAVDGPAAAAQAVLEIATAAPAPEPQPR